MENDQYFMRKAIEVSESALRHGNHPFSALLVKDGKILLTAENSVVTGRDVTGHAETNLVRLATGQFDRETLSQCTLYASTEPCVMCAGAIFWAGIPRVVFGCSVPTFNQIFGGEIDIRCQEVFARGKHKTEVVGPVLENEALEVLKKFFH